MDSFKELTNASFFYLFLQVGAVDRYENLLARAGLHGRVVDYLKLDVELSELEFFQDMFFNTPHLLAGVKQIAMEVHHDVEGGKQARRENLS